MNDSSQGRSTCWLFAPPRHPEGVGRYIITRSIFVRLLAFVYAVAFLVAYSQNTALLGDDGALALTREII